MSIQATNNNARIDWSSLLNKLDAASKAVETQGAGGVTAGSSVTITANVDGVEKAITFPVPDDLDLPAAVDQAGIDSLCAKLAGNQSLGLTEADVKAVHDALSAALAAATPSLSASTGSKSVMFDLYKLMALLVEVGQKQRDAAREMREAESAQIQKAIQNQADQQKAAALTGMIAGAICCAIQVAVSVGMLAKQGSAFKQQLNTLGTSGVDAAKQNLSMVKAADSPEAAKTQLDNVKASIGGKTVPGQHRTLGAEIEHSFETADQAQARLGAAKAQLTADGQKLQRVADPGAQRQPGDVPPDSDLGKAEARLAKFDRMTELDAKENRTVAETRELLELRNQVGDANRAQLQQDVETGRQTLVSELQSKIVADGDKVETSRQAYREAIKTDLGRYENEYQAALSERSLAENPTKAEIARLDANVETAANKLQYARAFANDKLAQPGVTTAAERAADIKLAADQIDSAMHSRSLDSAFLRASFQLQTTEVKLGIVNAIGNATQSFISGLTSYIQAGAKEGEAQQNKAQEELDQTKDLFNQAQELVDAVVQLMQAVTSAESQSMRDAIQA
jgi:hypothetical protein